MRVTPAVNEPTLQTLDVNGLRMRVAIQGTGPLVILCHGFPELWCSWRQQMRALAAAGYRCVAPDDGPDRVVFGRMPHDKGFLENMEEPGKLPAWLSEADIAEYAAEFSRTGFRGGLNWYRNIARSSELLAPWRGMVIRQPSMFIAGSRDDVLKFPGTQSRLDKLAHNLPGLRGCHIIEGAGHWIQRERAPAVNELLLDFLSSNRS